MMTRFGSLMESPDAKEGGLANSEYSTERTPVTALLFEAKRNIALPLIRPAGDFPAKERRPETRRKAERSQEQ
jgi:hypothetical protein